MAVVGQANSEARKTSDLPLGFFTGVLAAELTAWSNLEGCFAFLGSAGCLESGNAVSRREPLHHQEEQTFQVGN